MSILFIKLLDDFNLHSCVAPEDFENCVRGPLPKEFVHTAIMPYSDGQWRRFLLRAGCSTWYITKALKALKADYSSFVRHIRNHHTNAHLLLGLGQSFKLRLKILQLHLHAFACFNGSSRSHFGVFQLDKNTDNSIIQQWGKCTENSREE